MRGRRSCVRGRVLARVCVHARPGNAHAWCENWRAGARLVELASRRAGAVELLRYVLLVAFAVLPCYTPCSSIGSCRERVITK